MSIGAFDASWLTDTDQLFLQYFSNTQPGMCPMDLPFWAKISQASAHKVHISHISWSLPQFLWEISESLQILAMAILCGIGVWLMPISSSLNSSCLWNLWGRNSACLWVSYLPFIFLFVDTLFVTQLASFLSGEESVETWQEELWHHLHGEVKYMIKPTLHDVMAWIQKGFLVVFTTPVMDQIIKKLEEDRSYVCGPGDEGAWKEANLYSKDVWKDESIVQVGNIVLLNSLVEKVRHIFMTFISLFVDINKVFLMLGFIDSKGQVSGRPGVVKGLPVAQMDWLSKHPCWIVMKIQTLPHPSWQGW